MDKSKKRLALLSKQQLQSVIGKLDESLCDLLSDDQIKNLDFSNLRPDTIKKIIGCPYLDKSKKRFGLLSKEQVQSIIDKLDASLLDLVSDVQLKGINLSTLEKEEIDTLFPPFSKDTIKKTEGIGLVRWEQSKDKNGNLKSTMQRGISDKEANRISQERQRANKKRLSQLSPSQIQAIRDKLSIENLQLLNTV